MPAILPGQVPEPPRSGKPGGLGEKIENALHWVLTRALNNTRSLLAGILKFALDTFLEGLEPFLIRSFRPLLSSVSSTDGCPSEIKELIDRALSGESQAGVAVLGMIGGSVGGAAMGSVTGVLFAGWTRAANWRYRPNRPDIGTVYTMLRRGAISVARFSELYRDIGWPDDVAGAIGQITQPRVDIPTLVTDAFRRGLPLTSLNPELLHRGFDQMDIDAIYTAVKPIPGPGDLISMAVREAWDDGVAARYGYDQDFPAPFAEWMKKQGYDPEWAKRWWRAHWEVPGPTMAREMLHRTSMTQADYATLLKIADYPVRFRQWMTEVAYEPYTRVDIRRMYQVGVLKTYAELVHAYNDIGYDNEKAAKLADFTVLEYGETEREATKTEVLQAYGIGRLSQAETRAYLAEMGYPDWVVETYIARVDLGRSNGIAASQISHAQTMYVNGQFSKTDVYTALNKIPLASSEVERYLEEWEISRTAKIARPTRADLRKFFLQNSMSEAEFRQELAGFRLSTRYIDWYVIDAKRDLVKTATAEVSTATTEVTRVQTAVAKTVYDVRIADLSVEIARLNLTIADLKASSTPEMTLAEITELGELVVNCQLQIKALQLEKAQVWAAYLREKGKV